MTDKWSERRQIERRRERAETAAALRALCERSADAAPYDELGSLILRALKAGAFPNKALLLLGRQAYWAKRLPKPGAIVKKLHPIYRKKNHRPPPVYSWQEMWWGELVREVSPLNRTAPQYDWRDHAAAIADAIERANVEPIPLSDKLKKTGSGKSGDSKKKGRGRPPDTDPVKDKRAYDDWKASKCKKYEDFARVRGMSAEGLKNLRYAVERHRKRTARKRK